jgi:hypothetical protein
MASQVAPRRVVTNGSSYRGSWESCESGGAARSAEEGTVAKRKAAPYGPEALVYKIKSQAYTRAEALWELNQKR